MATDQALGPVQDIVPVLVEKIVKQTASTAARAAYPASAFWDVPLPWANAVGHVSTLVFVCDYNVRLFMCRCFLMLNINRRSTLRFFFM